MGQGASKPGDSAKHVFTSDTPIQFSQELIDSLQASSETNSSRAKTLDLHIAQRVHEELEKIQKAESSRLDELRKKLSSDDSSSSSGSSTSSNSSGKSPALLELPSISPKDLFASATESKDEKARKEQSSKKVQGEIEKLRKALGERKTLREIPKEVDQARGDVIACLRTKDRQPLDCWREVEVFKREVRKMEEQYVGSLL